MNQSKTIGCVDGDEFSVLSSDEVDALRVLAAAPGMGHLALFREEKREIVLSRCGLSPRIGELRELWKGDWDEAWEWFDEGAMVHASVYEVGPEGDVGSSFVGFAISPCATGLGARLVWKVLVDESPQWSKFVDMRVGAPELAGKFVCADEGSGVEERAESVRDVVKPECPQWPSEVLEHADRVLEKYDLQQSRFAGCDETSGVDVSRDGCCYLQLFLPESRSRVFQALGLWPLVGRVFELYSAAVVRGFASFVGLEFEGDGVKRHMFVCGGNWKDNLVRLTALASQYVEARVGGSTCLSQSSVTLVDDTVGAFVARNGGFTRQSWRDSGGAVVPTGVRDEQLVLSLLPCAEVPVCLLPGDLYADTGDCEEVVGTHLRTGREYICDFPTSTVLVIPKGVRVGFSRFTLDCDRQVALVRVTGKVSFTVWSAALTADVLRASSVTAAVGLSWDQQFGKLRTVSYIDAMSRDVVPSVFILRAAPQIDKKRAVVWPEFVAAVQVHDELCTNRMSDVWRVPDIRELILWPKGRRKIVTVAAVGRQKGFHLERSPYVDHTRVSEVLRVGCFYHELMVDGSWPAVFGSGWPVECRTLHRVSVTVDWPARGRTSDEFPIGLLSHSC